MTPLANSLTTIVYSEQKNQNNGINKGKPSETIECRVRSGHRELFVQQALLLTLLGGWTFVRKQTAANTAYMLRDDTRGYLRSLAVWQQCDT